MNLIELLERPALDLFTSPPVIDEEDKAKRSSKRPW